ncbi:hypothetical protein V8C42DRAFT_355982 [Trichoderma barbatum]
MVFSFLAKLTTFALFTPASVANIIISPVTNERYETGSVLNQPAHAAGTRIGGAAGIHPFQSKNRSWDALVTLHVMILLFSEKVDSNYGGKYFQTPDGQLYLVYQKQKSRQPKCDGVGAWSMDNPNYISRKGHFKHIETGNIHAINGKFFMAYSVGDSKPKKEVYYPLQSEDKHNGWHYIGDQVLAPRVPTVTQIGLNNSWILLFAGYNPNDASLKDGIDKFQANHRRPYFTQVNVDIPRNLSLSKQTINNCIAGFYRIISV